MNWIIAVTAVLVSLAVAGAAAVALRDPPPGLSRLVIATGGVGGVYFNYGQGIANAARAAYPDATAITVRETAASVANLGLIAEGQADVGFTLADSAALAVRGEAPFVGPQPITALARLYDNYTQLVVRAQSPVAELEDLKGKPVSTGAPDSGTELVAARLLGLVGLQPDRDVTRHRLDLAESVRALEDGRIAAFFFSGGLPTAAIADLARRTPIRLVNLGRFVTAMRAKYGEFYSELPVPAFVYGLVADVATVGVPNYLVVSSRMPEAEAYALTRLLFEAKATLVAAHPEARRLNRRAAISTYPVPLHPGAARYYREVKP
ncbi:MAG TPA: transporter [Micromonosporaceae bacterium]|nr:transporter [Micromonosporaceae bacterium]